MIICICNTVSDTQIREMLPASIEDVMVKTNTAMCCGNCFSALQKIIEEQHNDLAATVLGRLSSICSPIQDS